MSFYLDTSVVVPLYIEEKRSADIEKRLKKESGLFISPLTEVEFHSAVSRRVRMNEISRHDGQKIISQFRLHIENNVYGRCDISYRQFLLAREWLSGLNSSLRTLDSLHLAAAYSNNLTLLTADEPFAAVAKKLGLAVIIP